MCWFTWIWYLEGNRVPLVCRRSFRDWPVLCQSWGKNTTFCASNEDSSVVIIAQMWLSLQMMPWTHAVLIMCMQRTHLETLASGQICGSIVQQYSFPRLPSDEQIFCCWFFWVWTTVFIYMACQLLCFAIFDIALCSLTPSCGKMIRLGKKSLDFVWVSRVLLASHALHVLSNVWYLF